MKILVTGFDPFGGEKINPSFEAVKKIKLENKDIELHIKEIPTVFKKAIKVLDQTIAEVKPDVVICTGQAGGRYEITPERVGINIVDARISDNEGDQPVDEKIFEDGENAYFATLPIKAAVKNLKEEGIPASVSNTAGTFVCNHLLYGLMYLIDKKYPGVRGGFVHVPFLPEQVLDKAQKPYMSLGQMAEALSIIVETSATVKEDIKEVGGKTH